MKIYKNIKCYFCGREYKEIITKVKGIYSIICPCEAMIHYFKYNDNVLCEKKYNNKLLQILKSGNDIYIKEL